MASCMSWYYLLGEAVVNPPFRERFLADPAGVYRRLGGSRLVPALEALTAEDTELLGKQLAGIQKTIGDRAGKITDHTGFAIVFGRVLADPEFSVAVQQNPAVAMEENLISADEKGEIAQFFSSKEFKALGNLDQHRKAMQNVGARFDQASARSSLRATVLRTVLRELQEDLQEGRIRL